MILKPIVALSNLIFPPFSEIFIFQTSCIFTSYIENTKFVLRFLSLISYSVISVSLLFVLGLSCWLKSISFHDLSQNLFHFQCINQQYMYSIVNIIWRKKQSLWLAAQVKGKQYALTAFMPLFIDMYND